MAPDSTAYTLRCIHPMIDYHMVLAKKVHLVDALKVKYFVTLLLSLIDCFKIILI